MPNPTKKTNPILPLGIVAIMFVVILMGYVLMKSNSSTGIESASGQGAVTPASVEADSPVETIKSLQGTTLQMLSENEALMVRNEKTNAELLKLEEDRLEEMTRLKNELAVSAKNNEASNAQTMELIVKQVESISSSFQQDIAALTEKLEARVELEDEMSLRPDEMEVVPSYSSGERIPATTGFDIVYVQSLDQRAAAASNPEGSGGIFTSVPSVSNGLSSGKLLKKSSGGSTISGDDGAASFDPNVLSSIAKANRPEPIEVLPEEEVKTVPYFTVPDLSVLSNGSALTALMGKVYRDDKIVNPVPIKVMVGRSNLTANFKELPADIEGIIFGGYAIGDPTFACVKANLTAATFVFDDGTVKSAYIGDEGARPDNDAYPDDTIGYISDPWGNPCIPGTYVTDAVKQLGSLALLDGVAGYARALRQQEVETSIFSDGGDAIAIENLTGSASSFALASGVADGLDNASAWARTTFEKIFEGYYIRAGVNVSIHVEQELRLDKDPDARKIRYTQSSLSNTRLD